MTRETGDANTLRAWLAGLSSERLIHASGNSRLTDTAQRVIADLIDEHANNNNGATP